MGTSPGGSRTRTSRSATVGPASAGGLWWQVWRTVLGRAGPPPGTAQPPRRQGQVEGVRTAPARRASRPEDGHHPRPTTRPAAAERPAPTARRLASPRPPSARHQPGLLRGAPPPRRLARRPAARRTPPLAAYPRRAPPPPSTRAERRRRAGHRPLGKGRAGVGADEPGCVDNGRDARRNWQHASPPAPLPSSCPANSADPAPAPRRAGWWRTTRPGRPPNAGPWRGTSEQSGELSVMGQPLRNGYKPPSSSRASATSTSTSSTRSTPFPRPPPSPRTPNTGSWARRPPRRRYRQSHQIGLACRGLLIVELDSSPDDSDAGLLPFFFCPPQDPISVPEDLNSSSPVAHAVLHF